MAAILQKAYRYMLYCYNYLLSTWPVYWIHKFRSVTAASNTVWKVGEIVKDLYHHQQQEEKAPTAVDDICRDVSALNFHEDILSIKDELCDLNLLQHAIITNCADVVQLLLSKVTYPSRVGCNSPVHMAACLGHTEVLRCLIKQRPYDLFKSAGLCYPSHHEPISHSKRFGVVFQPVYKCEEEKLLPLEWAIMEDHIDTVIAIIQSMELSDSGKINMSKFLHFSACKGAEKCIKYFVNRCPSHVNHVNTTGDVPLLEAVVWGPACAKVLIDNGADVNMVAENGDTALHRLYRNDVDGIFAIFDTTRYLLTTGIEQLINSINLKGETALHLLVTHVSYIGGNYHHLAEKIVPRWQMQPDYQTQVIHTIQLLLSFNADPHIYDSLRLQPLNKLLHVTMKASRPNDVCECVQGSINSKYVYRNDFGSLGQAINVLIKNGAEVDTQCAIGHTPLILLVQTLLHTDIPDIIQQQAEIVTALEVLFQNGAKCNFLSEDQCTCASLLAILAKKLFQNQTPGIYVANDHELRQQYGDFINDILVIFLSQGLNPNFTTTKKSRHLSGGSGNALIEFVRVTVYAVNLNDFKIIHRWLRTLLQFGADPDIEAYPSDPIICHSQSSIFLKKQGTQAVSHYIHEVKELQAIFEQGHAEELLMLFYKSMEHKVLYDCLTTAQFMARFHPLGATGQNFLAVLNSMSEQPRSLKQMTRVVIYKAVDRKLTTTIDQLPLPKSLKQYLLNIE